jgi:hypothetical protein
MIVCGCCTGLADSGIMPTMKYWEIVADKLSAAGASFALLLFAVASALAKSPAPEVIFISPCECQGFHGKHRWIAKTDLTPVPLDRSAIQSVIPSQIYAWEGIGADVDLAHMVEARMASEEKWYALTGRIVDAKVEADGDIQLALVDAIGNNVGTVSAEIPVGPKWCEIRETVFGWTTQKFPFSVKTAHDLKIREPRVITVTGKAFYDKRISAAGWWGAARSRREDGTGIVDAYRRRAPLHLSNLTSCSARFYS